MAWQHILNGFIEVIPIENPANEEAQIEEDTVKQLKFTIPETGEVVFYNMTKSLYEKLARDLKASNKGLRIRKEQELQEQMQEAERQAMRARLAANGGGPPAPGEQKIVDDILKGVHRKEE